MIPFFIKMETRMYLLQVLVLFTGYLVPSTFSARLNLKISIPVWIAGSLGSIILYDFLKSLLKDDYVFLGDWKKFYPVALLFFMGIHGYSRFVSALIFKQLTKKN
jgi:hypothetical protein